MFSFRQDEATPNYTAPVSAFLDEVFGISGHVDEVASYITIFYTNYFFWEYFESKIFLKPQIRPENRIITADVIDNVQHELVHLLGYCQIVNGPQIEHLL